MNKKGNFLVLLLMLGMLFGLPGSMFAQKHVVTGTVVDQNGEPMVAVTQMILRQCFVVDVVFPVRCRQDDRTGFCKAEDNLLK